MTPGRLAPALALAVVRCAKLAYAQHWPIEPADQDHHVMTTFEYVDADGGYFHQGLDIFAASTSDASPPWVLAVGDSTFCPSSDPCDADGCTVSCDDVGRGCSGTRSNGCWVEMMSGGRKLTFGHLDCDSYDVAFLDAFENAAMVTDAAHIARIERWSGGCPTSAPTVWPNHLHFEILDCASGQLVNPATVVAPFGATDVPSIVDLRLAEDDAVAGFNAWNALPGPAVPGTCTAAVGNVDLIARTETRHRPDGSIRHGDNLGARTVRWRACGGADPDCAWKDALDLFSMDPLWTIVPSYANAAYAVDPVFDSDSSYTCGDDLFYVVPTNVVAGSAAGKFVPSRSGAWRIGTLVTPPAADSDHVTVTVQVEDLAGGIDTRTVPVCLRNAGPGVAKLVVRDCATDDASEPSACDVWTDSPDIVVEDTASVPTDPLVVRVCMTNVGNGSIPSASTVSVAVHAESTAGSTTCAPADVTASPPASALSTRLGGAVPAADWLPGEERCAKLGWPPAGTPTGWRTCDRFTASVSGDHDTPNTHASEQYDNNRAVKDVDLGVAGGPADVTGLHRFDVRFYGLPPEEPADDPSPSGLDVAFVGVAGERDWWWYEPMTRPAVPRPRPIPPCCFELHVGPGTVFEGLEGGYVIGTVTDRTYRAWNARRPASRPESGLEITPDTKGTAGSSASVWRIIAVPSGVARVALVSPTIRSDTDVRVLAWSDGEDAGDRTLPPIRVSVYGRPGADGRPIELFQRISAAREQPASAAPR